MPVDAPAIWLPPAPAIIRPAADDVLKYAGAPGLPIAAAPAGGDIIAGYQKVFSGALGSEITTHTQPDIDFLAADETRRVIAAVGFRNNGSSRSLDSITALGTALSPDIQRFTGAVQLNVQIWSGIVPAGQAGSLVLTFNNDGVYARGAVYVTYGRSPGAGASDPNVDASNSAASLRSDTANISAGGVMIAAQYRTTDNGHDFAAGVDQDEVGLIEDQYASMGSRLYESAATPATVTTETGSSATSALLIQPYNPV